MAHFDPASFTPCAGSMMVLLCAISTLCATQFKWMPLEYAPLILLCTICTFTIWLAGFSDHRSVKMAKSNLMPELRSVPPSALM